MRVNTGNAPDELRTTLMSARLASCSCGELRLSLEGEPVRVSVCHCLACQQRTGSAFGAQARFHRDQVRQREGRSTEFVRTGDAGSRITLHFCPLCGTTVFWEIEALPDHVAVAMGAFADPKFPAPTVSVYEDRRHAWVSLGDTIVERWD